MSDFYEDENENVQGIEPQVDEIKSEPVEVKRKRYASIKDQTKRREQARINLAKGRETRARNLKRKKEEEAMNKLYNIPTDVSDDDYSSASEEMKLVKKISNRKPTRVRHDDYMAERMDKMEQLLIQQLKEAKKKTTRPIRQTIIQVPNQHGGGGQTNPQLQNTKKYLLDL